MTKLKAMKIIKDVMTGRSNHTHGLVYTVGKKWRVETAMNRIATSSDGEGWVIRYCCNKLTIKEIKEMIKDNYCAIHNNYYNSNRCSKEEYIREYHKK